MFSSSDIVYDVSISWNDILLKGIKILVCETSQIKETTINYFELRYQRSIVGYSQGIRNWKEIQVKPVIF